MDWTELVIGGLIGAVLALPFEFLCHMRFDSFRRRKKIAKLKQDYSFLARRYNNFENGDKPTGGSILLEQNKDGSFAVTALNPDGSIEWDGSLHMSPDEKDIGTASYKYLNGINHGDQRVVYVRHLDVLHVLGTNASTTQRKVFMHVWAPNIRVGHTIT
jgi:hypothetical protein